MQKEAKNAKNVKMQKMQKYFKQPVAELGQAQVSTILWKENLFLIRIQKYKNTKKEKNGPKYKQNTKIEIV